MKAKDYNTSHCFFFRRKWLPPPLRKLSGGKVEKGDKDKIATSASAVPALAASDKPLLKKTGSEKRFKVCFQTLSAVGYVSSN